MKTTPKSALTIAAGILAIPLSAPAVSITYGSRGAFNAAVGATTLIDFESNVSGDATYYGASLTIGSVTFTQPDSRLFVLSPSLYRTVGTSYLNNNAGASGVLGVSFANPVYSIGMDLGFVYNFSGGQRNVTALLSSGESFTASLSKVSNYNSGVWSFFGLTSDVGITSLSFSDPTDGLAIDNFAYATGSSGSGGGSSTSVPDGGTTAAMLGLALGGMAVLRRKLNAV